MDTYGKYIRLFGNIFFTFIGFIVLMILIMLGCRLFFDLLSFLPWTVYIYMLFIITVPAAIFIPVYVVYFRRTKRHPSLAVRYVSYGIFTIALLLWAIAFASDIFDFFKHYSATIASYKSYELYFLAANVAAIFFVGILQALTMTKEVDWMEKYK